MSYGASDDIGVFFLCQEIVIWELLSENKGVHILLKQYFIRASFSPKILSFAVERISNTFCICVGLIWF